MIEKVHGVAIVVEGANRLGRRGLLFGARAIVLIVMVVMMARFSFMIVVRRGEAEVEVGPLGMVVRFSHFGARMRMRQGQALSNLHKDQECRNDATHLV